MRHSRARGRGLALLVVAALLSGCGVSHLQDLNFRVDDRLTFTAPEDRSTVHQPFTVSWTIHDFTVVEPGSAPPSRDAGYFGVFVDRTPIKPGESLRAIGKDDPACKYDPTCPDTLYLHQNYVFPTTATQLRLRQIPNIIGSREAKQLHTITVVLLDTSGRRIGESAWQLDVWMPKVGTT